MNKPGYLRFDFNYTEQLTPAQVEQIQAITNEAVDTDWAVNTVETSLEEAKAMGAMALFGENYGSTVRVVEIGGPFSMELCGGTHVAHSSQIGPVALLGESSIGSGVRRIEAYSGLNSFNYLSKERALAEGLASSLKAPSEELPERVAQLVDKLKAAEKEIEALHRQQLMAQTADLLNNAQEIGGVTTLLLRVKDNTNAGDLRTIATTLKDKLGDREGVLVIASDNAGKVPFVVAATKAAVARGAHSGNLVKLVGSYIDGRGGGKADLAQGSGANIAGLESAFGAVRAEIEAL